MVSNKPSLASEAFQTSLIPEAAASLTKSQTFKHQISSAHPFSPAAVQLSQKPLFKKTTIVPNMPLIHTHLTRCLGFTFSLSHARPRLPWETGITELALPLYYLS